MCTYTRRILNKRFTPTRKNGWNPPVCHDERLRYIEIECGHCYECKRKKARQWRIRMAEQLRETPTAVFFTGTFSPERIEKICSRYNIEKEEANEIATKEVRLFLERLRKQNGGKSVKHWIVTEKGHTNTRRIHIHGLFFAENGMTQQSLTWLLRSNWIAGYCYNGQYVNEKTINYISKYLTKTDLDNPEFEGKVLASPGLGKNFINRPDGQNIHYFPKTETKRTTETYRFRNGTQVVLPKYYKEKLFTEDEREKLWIEKQEEGYKFIMGEKILVKTQEDEEVFNKLVIYYRDRNASVHKDNPDLWERNKWWNKHKNHLKYGKKWIEEYKKDYRRERKSDIELQKDLKQYEKWYWNQKAET